MNNNIKRNCKVLIKGDQFLYKFHKNCKQIAPKASPIESFTPATKAHNSVQNKWALWREAHNCTSFYREQKTSVSQTNQSRVHHWPNKELSVQTKLSAIFTTKHQTIDSVSQWLHRKWRNWNSHVQMRLTRWETRKGID